MTRLDVQIWDDLGERSKPSAAPVVDPHADCKAQNEAMHIEIGRLHGLLEGAQLTIQSERDRKFQEIAQIRVKYETMEQELRATQAELADATGKADALIKERMLREGRLPLDPFAMPPPPLPLGVGLYPPSQELWRSYAQPPVIQDGDAGGNRLKAVAKDFAEKWGEGGFVGRSVGGPMDRQYWH